MFLVPRHKRGGKPHPSKTTNRPTTPNNRSRKTWGQSHNHSSAIPSPKEWSVKDSFGFFWDTASEFGTNTPRTIHAKVSANHHQNQTEGDHIGLSGGLGAHTRTQHTQPTHTHSHNTLTRFTAISTTKTKYEDKGRFCQSISRARRNARPRKLSARGAACASQPEPVRFDKTTPLAFQLHGALGSVGEGGRARKRTGRAGRPTRSTGRKAQHSRREEEHVRMTGDRRRQKECGEKTASRSHGATKERIPEGTGGRGAAARSATGASTCLRMRRACTGRKRRGRAPQRRKQTRARKPEEARRERAACLRSQPTKRRQSAGAAALTPWRTPASKRPKTAAEKRERGKQDKSVPSERTPARSLGCFVVLCSCETKTGHQRLED